MEPFHRTRSTFQIFKMTSAQFTRALWIPPMVVVFASASSSPVIGQTVYWTGNGEVSRAKVANPVQECVVSGLTNPSGIAINISTTPNMLYWADATKIHRAAANLNCEPASGAQVETLVTGLGGLHDVKLDVLNGYAVLERRKNRQDSTSTYTPTSGSG